MLDFFGLSQGHTTVGQADRWLAELVSLLGRPAGTVACTHLVQTPFPHVAVSIAVQSTVDAGAALPTVPPDLKEAAEQAVAEHVARHSGRAVVYPGVDRLVGTLTVAELVARSAIERVVLLDHPDPAPQTLVETRDFVRPQWRTGRLTLLAAPASGGRIAPVEAPDPR